MIIYYKSRLKFGDGGFGHSFCNFLSHLILARIYNFNFFFDTFKVITLDRKLNVGNPFNDWVNFLNLNKLKDNVDIKDKKFMPIKSNIIIHKKYPYWGPVKFELIDNIIKNDNNCVFSLENESRIYIFDLYYYEKYILKNNFKTINNIFNDLNNLIQGYIEKDKEKKITFFYRGGDLNTKNNCFEIDIYFLLKEFIKDYEISFIISGTDKEINLITQKLKNESIKLLIREKDETKLFKIFINSNLLISGYSGFPLTAYYFNAKNIFFVKDYNDDNLKNVLIYKEYEFINTFFKIKNINLNDKEIVRLLKYI